MKKAAIIFRKELKDTLRDRRTLMMMVVMPLVVVPLLITVVVKIQQSQMEKAEAKRLTVAFVGKEHAPGLYRRFETDDRFTMMEESEQDTVVARTVSGELDGG